MQVPLCIPCKDARLQPMMDLMVQKWGAPEELPVAADDAGPAPAAADEGEDGPPDSGDAVIPPPPPSAYLVLAGLDSDDEGGQHAERLEAFDYALPEDEDGQDEAGVGDDPNRQETDGAHSVPGAAPGDAPSCDQVVQSVPAKSEGTVLGVQSAPGAAPCEAPSCDQVVQPVPAKSEGSVLGVQSEASDTNAHEATGLHQVVQPEKSDGSQPAVVQPVTVVNKNQNGAFQEKLARLHAIRLLVDVVR